jgi:hypothetical protein
MREHHEFGAGQVPEHMPRGSGLGPSATDVVNSFDPVSSPPRLSSILHPKMPSHLPEEAFRSALPDRLLRYRSEPEARGSNLLCDVAGPTS